MATVLREFLHGRNVTFLKYTEVRPVPHDTGFTGLLGGTAIQQS